MAVPPQDDEQRLRDAWAAWCEELKQAGEDVLSAPCALSDRAEGLRWVTRLTRFGLEGGVEFSDPRFPVFYKPTHETVKVMSDNPDAAHWMATIRPDAEYVLHGTRGTGPRIMFTTLARREGGGMTQQSGLDTSALHVRPDGSFTIHVSRTACDGNWLELKDGAQSLLVRALFADRKAEIAPTVRLEEVGGMAAPPPLDAAAMAARLDMARMVGIGTTRSVRRYADELRRNPPNTFADRADGWGAGDPGVSYLHGAWKLEPDEALVLDIAPGECSFWNVQINNRWAESLDYLHRQVHLNARTAVARPDGTIRAILAHADPGLSNWLDSEGHGEGTMLVRCMDARTPPQATARAVPFASLKDYA
ncbi:MAG: DUF1214 domain-containing protein [Novosphingobium sp.]|nr:DUF1214 domain-containing protein [Novosphingobium sp.]